MSASDVQGLLPCPFCGGSNVKTFGPVGWYRTYGISHSCQFFYNGAQEMAQGFHSEKDAIAAWNRRATPSALDADALAKLIREAEARGMERAAKAKDALSDCLFMLAQLQAESGRELEDGEEDPFRRGEWFQADDLMTINNAKAVFNGLALAAAAATRKEG